MRQTSDGSPAMGRVQSGARALPDENSVAGFYQLGGIALCSPRLKGDRKNVIYDNWKY